MRRILLILVLAVAAATAGCGSVVRVAYNNGDVAARFKAHEYFDLHGEQSDRLKAQIARFHAWHRREELPRYAALFGDASARLAAGLTRADVAWAIAAVRERYRVTVEQAADEFAPVAATMDPDNLAALERKLAENTEQFARDFLSGDAAKQARADRRRRQREFVALLRAHGKAPDLAARLRDYLVNWERDRGAEHRRQARAWEDRLVTLIVDLDGSLTPQQRDHVVRRFAFFAAEARVLARQGVPAGTTAGAPAGAALAAQ